MNFLRFTIMLTTIFSYKIARKHCKCFDYHVDLAGYAGLSATLAQSYVNIRRQNVNIQKQPRGRQSVNR